MWCRVGAARITVALALAGFGDTAGSAEARDVHPTAALPRAGDHTLLSWRDGPPYITNARPEDAGNAGYSSERRVLRLETGWYSADIDTGRIAITGFARHTVPRDEPAAERAALSADRLPRAQLHLAIAVGERVFTCTGRRAVALNGRRQPTSPLQFPVRVIESGRFFQKLALYDLEFRDSAGSPIVAAAHLEIAAWPDRLAVTLAVQPENAVPAGRAEVRLETSGGMIASAREPFAQWERGREHRSTLTVGADGGAIAPVPPAAVSISSAAHDPNGRTTLRWAAEEMCHEIALVAPRWPAASGTGYPETMHPGGGNGSAAVGRPPRPGARRWRPDRPGNPRADRARVACGFQRSRRSNENGSGDPIFSRLKSAWRGLMR